MKVTAVVPSAGSSRRMGPNSDKLFLSLKGRPLLAWTLGALSRPKFVDEIVLIVKKDAQKSAKKLVRDFGFDKVVRIIPGGKQRCDSVKNGLKAVSKDTDIVLIHDGARPFLKEKPIKDAIDAAKRFGAACLGVPVKPTIKKVTESSFIKETLKRDQVWEIQTPQAFKTDIITRAYKNLDDHREGATDDAYLVEKLGVRVKLVKGSYENIKITTPEDLIIAKAILDARS